MTEKLDPRYPHRAGVVFEEDRHECQSPITAGSIIDQQTSFLQSEIQRLTALNRELRETVGNLLLSADAAWEEHNLGHDWREACEGARELLRRTRPGICLTRGTDESAKNPEKSS